MIGCSARSSQNDVAAIATHASANITQMKRRAEPVVALPLSSTTCSAPSPSTMSDRPM